MPGLDQNGGASKGEDAAITVREIRRLVGQEAQALARLGRDAGPDASEAAGGIVGEVRRLVNGGGRAWIMDRDRTIVGYASIMPAPGLPGLYELDGYIAPAYRRQGLASHLLTTIVDRLADSPVRQLSYPAPDAQAPAAHFLMKNGFFVEHEEQRLVLDDLSALPAIELDRGFSLLTLARRQAVARFRQLYEASFGGLAWYQPYEDDREVARDLADAGDLLFLADGRRPVGFLWLRWPELASAEIEPVGLLPAYRGRGLGRQLVLVGLRRAAQQGADRVSVVAWRTNLAALTLYRQLGFRPAESKLYLAYDL